jgi:hypothetical protein
MSHGLTLLYNIRQKCFAEKTLLDKHSMYILTSSFPMAGICAESLEYVYCFHCTAKYQDGEQKD